MPRWQRRRSIPDADLEFQRHSVLAATSQKRHNTPLYERRHIRILRLKIQIVRQCILMITLGTVRDMKIASAIYALGEKDVH